MADYTYNTNNGNPFGSGQPRMGRFQSIGIPKEGVMSHTHDPEKNSAFLHKVDSKGNAHVRQSVIPAAATVIEEISAHRSHRQTLQTYDRPLYTTPPDCVATADGSRTMGYPGMLQRQRAADNYTSYDQSLSHGGWRAKEPTLIRESGWIRPGPAGWKAPPEQPLSKVTNDVGAAVNYLRESAGGNRWSPAWSPGNQATKPSTIIDSRDAVNRYGGQYI